MVGKRGPLVERFEAKFEKGPETECWPWLASHNGAGYGMIWDQERGRKVLATRVSYELYKGPIPDGGLILHSCDNPICVNPNHLRVGSYKDNVTDMDVRGRRVPVSMKGDGNPGAVLKAAEVTSLLKDYVDGVPRKTIASRYGISEYSLSDYTDGKSWVHLHGKDGCPTLEQLTAAKRTTPVTEEIARNVWRLHFAGKSVTEIAQLTKQSIDSVSSLVQGRTWRHLPDAPSDESLKAGGVRRGFNQFSRGGDSRALHPGTKIPSSEFPFILKRINDGETLEAIGRSYGVKKTTIWRIKKQA